MRRAAALALAVAPGSRSRSSVPACSTMVSDFSPGEQLALFHDNARRFYRI